MSPAVRKDFNEKPKPKVLSVPTGQLKTTNLSIKKMLQAKEEDLSTSGMAREDLPRNDFSFDDVKMIWRQYAHEMKNIGKETFYNAMIKRDPKVKDDVHLTMEVDNQIQVDYITPHLPDLMGAFRKHLQNYEITIEVVITDKQEEDVKYLTGKDKFAVMARKNPNLHTLKSTFNLDIEY